MARHYVDNKALEEWWTGWNVLKDPYAWDHLSEMIYLICNGVATRFRPQDDEEHAEHVHDAFIQTMDKIKDGRLKFTPGRAPAFNLLTTTIFRILYSKMNRQTTRREHERKYCKQYIASHAPEQLAAIDYAHAQAERARA